MCSVSGKTAFGQTSQFGLQRLFIRTQHNWSLNFKLYGIRRSNVPVELSNRSFALNHAISVFTIPHTQNE